MYLLHVILSFCDYRNRKLKFYNIQEMYILVQ